MDHYLEIRLLPDPEFAPTVLMNALFAKLHRALASLASGRIGICFPDAQSKPPTLGNRLRLHGSKSELQALLALNWLTGMRDHIRTQGPTPVPSATQHRTVRRVQAKSNPERLRRRLMKRKGIDADSARQVIPDNAAERLQLPFVTVKSNSNGQQYRLFIDHRPPVDTPVAGQFSHYGLSPSTTIPWF
jgi:CRISPR-associated endonuclease Csy4